MQTAFAVKPSVRPFVAVGRPQRRSVKVVRAEGEGLGEKIAKGVDSVKEAVGGAAKEARERVQDDYRAPGGDRYDPRGPERRANDEKAGEHFVNDAFYPKQRKAAKDAYKEKEKNPANPHP